jgi:hypothetical protein
MKKAFLILLAVMTVLILFTACEKRKKIIYTDPEEYNKAVSESVSESEKESSEQESKIEEDMIKTQSEMGKTIEGKQIVVKLVYGNHIQYEKVVFNKKGVADYVMTYKYFDTDDYYNMVLGYGDTGKDKLVDNSDELRCIVYKNNGPFDMDYETFYGLYSRKSPDICTIVE